MVPTERALITNDDSKPTTTRNATNESPKRIIGTNMPALYSADTDQDDACEKPLEIKFPKQPTCNERDQEDFLQIEDQDKNEELTTKTKKSIKAPTGRAQDLSVIDKFNSVDYGDKTIADVRGLFDGGTSRTTPKLTPAQTTPVASRMQINEFARSAVHIDES